ncbi:Vms1/Ankzf1 family peptidyl-tRNA hydrolase [Nocardiopsis ansamitocini]|uniref:Peptide chain release factor 1 n=1 Tax=Nocardiopsis ansamitocini TaxID=1670832 RepID=A0A9W6UI25_9ACTN|nr:Vms1/Ankzf1 family peptidyl-tRNA hydrolase [Nocardiopsis ansamitocini]GLU47282.1 hypothetical protein Nans01_16330 [Nocardiopsis ansamitocini]
MQLGFLRSLYAVPGPVASVFLDTTRTSENSDKEIELRWRGLREHLAEQGADDDTLSALDRVVGGASGVPGPQGEALFAAEGQVLATYTLTSPPPSDRASWLPIPDPSDLVADRALQLPYVVVAADREGADVDAYTLDRHDPVSERSFSGSTLHIQKIRQGGWAHKQYQRRAENLWDTNAEEVAKDVMAAVDEVKAELVFVGGDERAVGKLRNHLSTPVRGIVVDLPGGGRSDHAALARLREAVDEALSTAVAQGSAQEAENFADALGTGDAVQGRAETAEALRRGQVQTLLLGTGRDMGGTLWTSPTDPMEVSATREQLTDAGTALEVPADTALIRAAALSDAEFLPLASPRGATEGTGALLRFSVTG